MDEDYYVDDLLLYDVVDESLTYLSEKYGVSKPTFDFTEFGDGETKAQYDPNRMEMKFEVAGRFIVAHEWGHHIRRVMYLHLNLSEAEEEEFADRVAGELEDELYSIWRKIE